MQYGRAAVKLDDRSAQFGRAKCALLPQMEEQLRQPQTIWHVDNVETWYWIGTIQYGGAAVIWIIAQHSFGEHRSTECTSAPCGGTSEATTNLLVCLQCGDLVLDRSNAFWEGCSHT